jgi:Zn-dependent protease
MTFIIVLVGWLISLCLHEFSHALVAYFGGDYTVREKGYLTNPLKYINPVTSILLPLLFLVMGGIGLPGGAVLIETWRLRSPNWITAVSLAGPVSNLVLAVLLGAILRFAPLSADGIWPGLAFLAFLQVTAVLFNLIPIPPFDGYGAIRPHLDYNLREKMDAFGQVSMWVVLIAFWSVPAVSDGFWWVVGFIAQFIGIPIALAGLGLAQFQFWR